MKYKKYRLRFLLGGILLLLLLLLLGSSIYICDYYHADETALSVLTEQHPSVTITNDHNNRISFIPDTPKAGFIFYPGGKVQYESYAPLMEALAENGILCVLVHIPGNLAVLNQNAADGIPEEYPEITDWYIGGHSLGGAMAASYASKHSDTYRGLVLLGAYSTEDLTDSGLSVLSVYGSEDGILNRETYQSDFKNLPSDTSEIIIEGGCHSYFGDYGLQSGDGTPTIERSEQISQTVTAILNMLNAPSLTN
jgi:hypothetical protein